MKSKTRFIQYGSSRVIQFVAYSSLCVSLVLATLLVVYDITAVHSLRLRSIVALVVIAYLALCCYVARAGKLLTASWLLIALYALVASSTLLYWGLNASAGIYATSFVIILAGILLGSRAVFPVTIGVIALLCMVHGIHSLGIIIPRNEVLAEDSTLLDVVLYTTMLSVFAIIIWLSDKQIEKSIERTIQAEAAVRSQKATLASDLERESALLRESQLQEMQHLYKFATLGQQAAATLHELSNHLSVLNLDIDDLQQQHRNSRAIENAKESIDHINQMVRKIRRKLQGSDEIRVFKVDSVIRQILKDQLVKEKFKAIEVKYTPKAYKATRISGDSLIFNQILTVLITNALEACADFPNPKVCIRLSRVKSTLHVSVIDSGIGVSDTAKKTLFLPTLSAKPSGLGVGLYIARHLAESHFQGTIQLIPEKRPPVGSTQFTLTIPLTIPEHHRSKG